MDVESKPREAKQSSGLIGGVRDTARATYDKIARGPVGLRMKPYLPKSQRTRLLAGLLLLIAVIAIVVWVWRETGSSTEVLVVTVERADIEDSVTALGNLQPRDYVDVGAQVSGQLKKLYFDVGAQVKQGELLAEIDAQLQSAKVEADKAQLKNLRAQQGERQAQLELARGQHQRQKMLKSANATSEDAYQVALSALRSAEAGLGSIKAQIEQTSSTLEGDQVTLGYTKIYAPMGGTIVSVAAKQGQTLNANQQAPIILRVADLSTMTVWTQVSEADVPKLRVGMDAYFTILGTPNKRWTGKLKQILPTPESVNNVVLYTALFDVGNKGGELMTQMTAQVFFVIAGKKDVLTVPVSALQRYRPRQKLYRVDVVTAGGGHEQREVKVGVQNRVSAEIVSGLSEGDRVVAGTKSQTSSTSQQRNGQGGGRRGAGGFRGLP